MKKYTADQLLSFNEDIVFEEPVLIVNEDGEILALEDKSDHENSSIQHIDGILAPGFVNAHCHLELSHLKGQIDTGTKLIPFITGIVEKRDFPKETIFEKMKQADQDMYEMGISVVGDISNVSDSFEIKKSSKIFYHTFIELFDLMQESGLEKQLNSGHELFQQTEKLGISASLTPHAPYSVSANLFSSIAKHSTRLSIHNQETKDENQMFLSGKGRFNDFYEHFQLNFNHFKPSRKNSLPSILPFLRSDTPTLLIHNSFTTTQDIKETQSSLSSVFWCTCPNANLYIENRLPDYKAFIDSDSKMVIGTDSLSSNWQLSVLDEMKTIRKYCSYIPTKELMKWACIHGAQALGVENNYGSFTIGNNPGIIQITVNEQGEIYEGSKVRRIQ